MKIGYVCTNYNNSSFTLAAIESLERNFGHEFEVCVVDNASRPDQRAELRTASEGRDFVHVIESDVNHGYFEGLNVGLRFLRKRSPDIEWIVAGNNDLEFPPDFGDRLAANADRLREHAVVSPDVVTVEGEHQNPHVISDISRFRETVYDLYYSNYYLGMFIRRLAKALGSLVARPDMQEWQVARPVYQGHGSCYLLGPRFFREFGELWAPTFLMFEEYFLSKQLSDAGQQVWYDPCLQVVHHWHGSLQKLPGRHRWELEREASREYRKYVRGWR
jgi:GT2 family glycosyltransferase